MSIYFLSVFIRIENFLPNLILHMLVDYFCLKMLISDINTDYVEKANILCRGEYWIIDTESSGIYETRQERDISKPWYKYSLINLHKNDTESICLWFWSIFAKILLEKKTIRATLSFINWLFVLSRELGASWTICIGINHSFSEKSINKCS